MSFGKPMQGDGTGLSVYATPWPAAGGNPGQARVPAVALQSVGATKRNTRDQMLIAEPSGVATFLENWLPFTWAIVNRFITPRPPTAPWQSPLDVDASERIQRWGTFPSSARPFPYPYEIGAVSGLLPMLDQYSMAWAWARNPSGPGVMTPVPVPFQASYPNLQKVTG